MTTPLPVAFVGGSAGEWRIHAIRAVRGSSLPNADRLAVSEGGTNPGAGTWVLRGATSNMRYTHRTEAHQLASVQAGLGRPEATRAVLIPIRKAPAWWDLAQDERRAIFEERSRHIALSMEYLPAIARRLYHSRDLGEAFDFLTWFEFSPDNEGRFDKLVAALRDTEEWKFVEREVEVRVERL